MLRPVGRAENATLEISHGTTYYIHTYMQHGMKAYLERGVAWTGCGMWPVRDRGLRDDAPETNDHLARGGICNSAGIYDAGGPRVHVEVPSLESTHHFNFKHGGNYMPLRGWCCT